MRTLFLSILLIVPAYAMAADSITVQQVVNGTSTPSLNPEAAPASATGNGPIIGLFQSGIQASTSEALPEPSIIERVREVARSILGSAPPTSQPRQLSRPPVPTPTRTNVVTRDVTPQIVPDTIATTSPAPAAIAWPSEPERILDRLVREQPPAPRLRILALPFVPDRMWYPIKLDGLAQFMATDTEIALDVLPRIDALSLVVVLAGMISIFASAARLVFRALVHILAV